jgi:hypothetical protein
MNINEWAIKWNIPLEALSDLLNEPNPEITHPRMSEASVQQRIRLDGSKKGMRLWRNNVGAYEDKYGNFIRYGLANESTGMNRKIKSSDLIGITPHNVHRADVGKTIGIFTAIEVKGGDWQYKGNDHEKAQAMFHKVVKSLGGIGGFANSEEIIKTLP